MTVYLFALTSSGGVPLYSRTLGEGKSVSRLKIWLINGVEKSMQCYLLLLNNLSRDACIV